MKITVVEGDGAINNISQHRAKEPIVRVSDENNAPIKGASVTFVLPEMGPGGEFGGGARMLTVMTDDRGEAVGRGLAPNQSTGRFQIRAVASAAGQTATAVINQTNAEPLGASGTGSSKKFLLIAVVGGAAAAGAALAARGHSGSNQAGPPPSNSPSIVITPGQPGFQPPH